MAATVTPYNSPGSKKEQVARMFDNIAGRYDFMNNLLSVRIHVLWRRKAIRLLKKSSPKTVLDVATGTADFAIAAMKLHPVKVTGIDISEKMLGVGREKIAKKGLQERIELRKADSEKIPFADNTFDAITVGFGVRNFEDLDKGLHEMQRVLKPGGQVAILEFSKVKVFPVRQIYHFYFRIICPLLGRIFTRDRSAYSYLHRSVDAFPEGKEFCERMERSGFVHAHSHTLSFGVASIYTATK